MRKIPPEMNAGANTQIERLRKMVALLRSRVEEMQVAWYSSCIKRIPSCSKAAARIFDEADRLGLDAPTEGMVIAALQDMRDSTAQALLTREAYGKFLDALFAFDVDDDNK